MVAYKLFHQLVFFSHDYRPKFGGIPPYMATLGRNISLSFTHTFLFSLSFFLSFFLSFINHSGQGRDRTTTAAAAKTAADLRLTTSKSGWIIIWSTRFYYCYYYYYYLLSLVGWFIVNGYIMQGAGGFAAVEQSTLLRRWRRYLRVSLAVAKADGDIRQRGRQQHQRQRPLGERRQGKLLFPPARPLIPS